MHLFGGCFDIFPSWIVVVEWCYTITILAFIVYIVFFSILATLLTTSFCAVFVGFSFIYGHLGLAGCRIKKPNHHQGWKKERSTGRGTSRRGRSNVKNEINVRIASSKAWEGFRFCFHILAVHVPLVCRCTVMDLGSMNG